MKFIDSRNKWMKMKIKKTEIFLLTAVQQMLPTLTLQWLKLVWNIKTRICCDEHVQCIFPPSWFEPSGSAVAPNPTSFKNLNGVLDQKTIFHI